MSSSGALAISFDLRIFLWVAGHRRLFQARQNGAMQELYAGKVSEIKTLEQSDKVELDALERHSRPGIVEILGRLHTP